MARPTKFTPARLAALIQTLRMNKTRTSAYGAAGISHETFSQWMNPENEQVLPEGLPEFPPLMDGLEPWDYPAGLPFPEAVTRAEAEAEAFAIERIRKAGTESAKVTYVYDRNGQLLRETHEYDWRAAAWLIEHGPQTKKRWMAPKGVEVSGPDGGPVQSNSKATVEFKPDEAFLRALAAAAAEVFPEGQEQ